MQTLGDVIMFVLIGGALIVVPYKLAKAWAWPHVRPFIMSRFAPAPARTSYEPAEPLPVLGQQNQIEPTEPTQNEPATEPFSLRQLPRRDLIVLLAVQRKEDGGYSFSANQITAFIGGTAAPVKELIADVRSGRKEEVKQPGHIERPTNGWHVKAS